MGLFDALKSVANMVTGGAAKVTLELGPRGPDGSLPAKIKAVADSDLKIEKVYLKVEGYETVTVKYKKEGQTTESEHSENATTYNQDITVAPAQTLTKGQEYSWDSIIRLPADIQPTYMGKKARHEWRVYAGLDATGTDPASSWVTFKV